MDETNWRDAQNEGSWIGEGGMAVSDDGRSVQSVAAPENPSGRRVVEAPKKGFFKTPRAILATVPLENWRAESRFSRAKPHLQPSGYLFQQVPREPRKSGDESDR